MTQPMHRRRLYGSRDGRWLIVDAPLDWSPPRTLDHLTLLGRLYDVFVEAWSVLEVRGYPPLASLAQIVGVGKTTLGNALRRETVPALSDAGWSTLARFLLDPGSVEVTRAPIGRPTGSYRPL